MKHWITRESTVGVAILVIVAVGCYVGSYRYFRGPTTPTIPIFKVNGYHQHFILNEKAQRLEKVYGPLLWLDRELTSTEVHFIWPDKWESF